MKERSEVSKHKSIKDVATRINFSGERSPYWEFLQRTQHKNESGELTEHVLANPDVLSDEESLYASNISKDGEMGLEVIQEVYEGLTPKQQRVLELCGYEGRTEEAAAHLLGIKRRTVRTVLDRIRTRVQQAYEKRKVDSR